MESPTVAADAISRKRDVDGILESGALGDIGRFLCNVMMGSRIDECPISAVQEIAL